MTMLLVILLVGLLLYFIPPGGPVAPGAPTPQWPGKINQLGFVLVFWAVYFLIAGFGGKSLRVASNETAKPEQRAASESTSVGRLPEGFPGRQHI